MDQESKSAISDINARALRFEGGRIYFSRDVERKFFFVLTLMMLVLGACFKLGVLE